MKKPTKKRQPAPAAAPPTPPAPAAKTDEIGAVGILQDRVKLPEKQG